MTKHCVLGSIVLVVIAFAVGFGVSEALEDRMSPVEEAPVEIASLPEGWGQYTNSAGGFTFLYPNGVHVSASADGKTIMLLPAPPEDSPVPDMTIKTNAGHVEFQTWENFEIPYFN